MCVMCMHVGVNVGNYKHVCVHVWVHVCQKICSLQVVEDSRNAKTRFHNSSTTVNELIP